MLFYILSTCSKLLIPSNPEQMNYAILKCMTATFHQLYTLFSNQGLLKVNPDKEVEVLAVEAEGLKFGITNGIDVTSDGTIYFTDASYKYNLKNPMLDLLEARPHGRLMSFDPSSKKTTMLVQGLYFANGVSVAPDQKSLIYCETVL
jgi:sugar lactone lactonase YvrE